MLVRLFMKDECPSATTINYRTRHTKTKTLTVLRQQRQFHYLTRRLGGRSLKPLTTDLQFLHQMQEMIDLKQS